MGRLRWLGQLEPKNVEDCVWRPVERLRDEMYGMQWQIQGFIEGIKVWVTTIMWLKTLGYPIFCKIYILKISKGTTIKLLPGIALLYINVWYNFQKGELFTFGYPQIFKISYLGRL